MTLKAFSFLPLLLLLHSFFLLLLSFFFLGGGEGGTRVRERGGRARVLFSTE